MARWNGASLCSVAKHLAIGPIPIADEIFGRLLPAAGLNELTGDPLSGRVRGSSQPQYPATVVPHYQQAKQKPE